MCLAQLVLSCMNTLLDLSSSVSTSFSESEHAMSFLVVGYKVMTWPTLTNDGTEKEKSSVDYHW